MITIRPSGDRGHAHRSWLSSYHTFSFADYYHPNHMGFRSLRVINEDWIAPGMGFQPHNHRNMEIVTYLLEGSLDHKDSMGNGTTMNRGDVQRMTAGTGVTHSEYNHSQLEPLHLLQIWILPAVNELDPGYEQRYFPDSEKSNHLGVIVSPDGRDGSLRIHQDVTLYASILDSSKTVTHLVDYHRYGWLQLIKGRVTIAGQILQAGDGAAIDEPGTYLIEALERAELLLFDLA